MDSPSKIGQKLKQAREKAGLDPASLAQKTKIQEDFILSLENDTLGESTPTPYLRAYLVTLCKALNLPQKDLLEEIYGRKDIDSEGELRSGNVDKQDKDSLGSKRPVILVVIAIVGFLLVLLIANFRGHETHEIEELEESSENTTDTSATSFLESSNTVAHDTITHDSIVNDTTVETLPVEQKTTETLPEETTSTPVKIPYSERLVVFRSNVDSVWIRLERSGKKAENILLRKTQDLKAVIADTFYVASGIPKTIEVHYKGKVHTLNTTFLIINGNVVP
jgi:cytoskeletal protein RodZ